jgi:hypothetical protein|uniref:Uncharacterized protein n=1 Tax=viral metagenome TaxID=1070528 RepID=A0A6C0IX66_9ZZZZ
MIPIGYEDAKHFKETRKLPGGSWKAWLSSCYQVVEQRFRFMCAWPLLVGMSVAMIELAPDTRVSFRSAARSDYNRSDSLRFLAYFIAMIDCLSGASAKGIEDTYRGRAFSNHRRYIPFTIHEWSPTSTAHILHSIRPQHVSLPLSRTTDADFYCNLLYGYYMIKKDDSILPLLYDEYRRVYYEKHHDDPLILPPIAFTLMFAEDKDVNDYFLQRL